VLLQNLREILTPRHIENYSRNAQSCIISPDLSHISEEMLSHMSPVIHESEKCETSRVTGSATSPSMAEDKEEFLNIQSGSLDQQNERHGLVKQGKEMAVRYWETAPVISFCRKRGDESCESLDKRMKQTAAHRQA